MTGLLPISEPPIEVILSDLDPRTAASLKIDVGRDLVVYIPLDSIGVTNSHIDICDDLLEAIWSAERLAANSISASVVRDYPADTHKTRLKLSLEGAGAGMAQAIQECAVLYNRYDDLNEQMEQDYINTRDAVLDLEGRIGQLEARLPEIVDDYFANLVGGAYYELKYDSPDRYESEMSKYPERRVGYWRSPFSHRVGASCYASPDGWLLDGAVDIDHFFRETGQKFKLAEFLPANVLTVNNASYVVAERLTAYFPMAQYFKSRICGSFALLELEDHWPPDTFDWSDASFTFSPYHEHLSAMIPKGMRAPPRRVEGCLVDPSGSLILVDDGQFKHLLYDTKALTLDGMKSVFAAIGTASSSLAASIGLAGNPNCNWKSLTDEQFEQLCYDLIYSHPLFDSATIRKHGNSRSRDGGRDIEVYDIPRVPGTQPRKWIFQCKLVTGSTSLSATKLLDVGDMLDHYDVMGFGVMTSTLIDATLYDKLDAVCGRRNVLQMNFSVLELERELARNEFIKRRYFAS